MASARCSSTSIMPPFDIACVSRKASSADAMMSTMALPKPTTSSVNCDMPPRFRESRMPSFTTRAASGAILGGQTHDNDAREGGDDAAGDAGQYVHDRRNGERLAGQRNRL